MRRITRLNRAHRGQVLLLSLIFLTIVLGLTGAFVSYVQTAQRTASIFSARVIARHAAQSGIDKAVWCLNQSVGTDCGGLFGGDYAGETAIEVGTNSFYTTTITANSGTSKTIQSVGYYPNVTSPIITVTLKADVTVTTTDASFHYGVQSGQGGFEFSNNAYVLGNIYANGNVIGASGVYVDGDVWVAGGTALTPDQDQSTNTEDYEFGRASPIIDIAQSFKLSADAHVNKISLYIKKTGNPSTSSNNIRILADNAGVPSKTVIGSGTLNASSVSTSFGWVDVSFSTPPGLVGGQRYWLLVDRSADSSDYFTIGSLTNNGYGNGVGMTSANWNASTPVWADAGRDYTFRIYTGGVATRVEDTHVYGDAHANTIIDSDIDGDAYYQTISGTTVDGTSYPGSADPGPEDLPISDVQITQWQSDAAAGGTITGDVVVDGVSQTLGPKKITGNLTVDNNAILTITGTLYVQGDITFQNNVTVRLDPGYGSSSGTIIADGKVAIQNNVTFTGSGTEGSYVLILTTNPSLDSVSPAMVLNNNSDNSIFYASKGMVKIENNALVKEVTAFKLFLSQNASVEYESGLANVNFSSGPGGSWALAAGSTREIR